MTTIAYRDGVLAADSLISSGNARAGQAQKIATCGSTMGGTSGSIEACHRFVQWIEAGAEGDCPELGDSDGILVRGSQTFYVGSKGVLVPFEAEFAAVGSGEKFALGAMAMGATAERAVEVARELDVHTGGQIVTLRHKG
ncbi:hypothetical protein [Kaistia sp. MMO-174]|uniref:hypothetical protein n=1 Tax=Kaistia sp. MMO-174 TaxID=3081256 RepID=UPI00301ADEC7